MKSTIPELTPEQVESFGEEPVPPPQDRPPQSRARVEHPPLGKRR
jgi:hypothetical protein